jgi:multidrug efflux pump
MQIYLGSLYVNDFNKFGRTYQVTAQADTNYRDTPDDIARIKVRNNAGEMIPLGSVVQVSETYGPESAVRYNAFRAADVNGNPAPGFSSGQAQDAITKILEETLPAGMAFEWTDLTYQQILAGDSTIYIIPLVLLLVFMVLAAQYESLFLPAAIIMIVLMSMVSALFGVWLTGGDNNIFTQISLFVLMGLATKNAILIAEFAHELEKEGMKTLEAAIEASHLRLRPILMTSFAFIMGVLPMAISTGAGSEMRNDMGVAVFAGMLGVTFFGLFLTPVFYVIIRKFEDAFKNRGGKNA